ncbi:carbon storage regulator CsrA [Paenibacillus alkaliterrae]|uniref:carbon storage regulator CsrA n=1 Tax=Paenibacillus alkaliterrae TaxID=320909 RepID=UPI001F1EAF37|nr:carbon storage regulator CsrA [Paenibacillus alkaliterrae]MCF2941388.1 carbon storage regulator CsrA [Paenibacillus alkaliterrae]
MLVLSRKSNESIMIGGNIEIVVLGVEGDTVKLGIRAPREVDIYRKEIYMAIQEENRAAATNPTAIDEVSKLFKK